MNPSLSKRGGESPAIRIRFPRELVEAVKRAAKAAGLTPSELIRRAVEAAVTRRGRSR